MVSVLKYVVLAAIAIAIGVGGAYAYHNYVVTSTAENFYYDQWEMSDSSSGDTLDPNASIFGVAALVGEAEHDFGVVEPSTILTHDFVFRNEGQSSLNIWLTESTAGPATVDLTAEPQIINGGAQFPVTVTLDTSKVEAEFTQTFTVLSEDADHPRFVLTVSGRPQ